MYEVGVQLGGGIAAVLVGGEDNEMAAGSERDGRKRPFVEVGGIVGEEVSGEPNIRRAIVVDFDPVRFVAVFVLQPGVVVGDELGDGEGGVRGRPKKRQDENRGEGHWREGSSGAGELHGGGSLWRSACDTFCDVAFIQVDAFRAALVHVDDLGVIEAEQAHDGRVQVVDVELVLDRVEAELVGGTDRAPALYASAGHPHGKAGRVVVTAVAFLTHRRPTEFAAPDD